MVAYVLTTTTTAGLGWLLARTVAARGVVTLRTPSDDAANAVAVRGLRTPAQPPTLSMHRPESMKPARGSTFRWYDGCSAHATRAADVVPAPQ
jgi:hypothetical protein